MKLTSLIWAPRFDPQISHFNGPETDYTSNIISFSAALMFNVILTNV